MEEENKFSNNLDVENMLQSSYEVDNESCEDSEVDASRSKITLEFSSPTRDMENAKILLEFVQAIKDDNCSYIKEFLEEDECNRTGM